MPRPKGSGIHTEASVYAMIKTFVLAEHRLPSAWDYTVRAHGLPSSSATVYRYCGRYKELLAKDGISYAVAPRHRQAVTHPWHDRGTRRAPVFPEDLYG